MWIRHRLDIGWSDLGWALVKSAIPEESRAARQRLETFWSAGRDDALACLSVRSAFDLLLQSLALPRGSEILFSAITVPDMPRIAKSHGLVPVPVDVCRSGYCVNIESLRKSVTRQSRIVVIAHLFGASPEIESVLSLAREYNLLVVEDCAQAWHGPQWRGTEEADASLFSFGAIKTATALGGALCRIKDPALLAVMRKIQAGQPESSSSAFTLKVCRFAILKAISTRIMFGAFVKLAAGFGMRIDDLLGNLTRGFSSESLLPQLRQQPSTGLLRLMEHRLRTYAPARIQQRRRNARRIIVNLGLENSHAELLHARHGCWLFPFLTDAADDLIPALRRSGFDTARRGRLEVIPPPSGRPEPDGIEAAALLARTVFLPCYPEMTDEAIDAMCRVIRTSLCGRDKPRSKRQSSA